MQLTVKLVYHLFILKGMIFLENDEKRLSQEDRIDNFRELLDRSVRRYGEREAFILKINHNNRVEEYSPFISLKDGSLVTSDFVYNFTK